jgi:hypothetical protein
VGDKISHFFKFANKPILEGKLDQYPQQRLSLTNKDVQ